VFFLLTNALIVFGLIAFDNAVAILNAFPNHYPSVPALPSPVLLVRALLLPAAAYDSDRIAGLKNAVKRLQRKSRSFFLASGVFQGRLRIDLITLYSYCRVADDLVDDAESPDEARQWIAKLNKFLDLSYSTSDPMAKDPNTGSIARFVAQNFPKHVHAALLQLPTDRLSSKPLYDLLKGFETDLQFETISKSTNGTFQETQTKGTKFPMQIEKDLDTYGERVAGTVAELCIDLVLFHYSKPGASISREEARKQYADIYRSGCEMGVALQYINIARDVDVDAEMDRTYIPESWIREENTSSHDIIVKLRARSTTDTGASGQSDNDGKDLSFDESVERLRSRLLDRAFAMYENAKPAIDRLPSGAQGAMRVAVESYVEIGRTLRQRTQRGRNIKMKRGRATVPTWRRLFVAYRALSR